MKYFDKAFEHKKKYETILNTGEYRYTFSLGSKVTFPSSNYPVMDPQFWQVWMKILANDLGSRIKADPKYAECFE